MVQVATATPSQVDQHERWKAARRAIESRAIRPLPAPKIDKTPISIDDDKHRLLAEKAKLIEEIYELRAETFESQERKAALDAEIDELIFRLNRYHDSFNDIQLRRAPNMRIIKEVVCKAYKISMVDMLSQRRTAQIVRSRQIAMYVCKIKTMKSLPEIGRAFGGKDHTTVLHAVRKIEDMRLRDIEFDIEISSLLRALTPEEARE
jgi:hypothetical protein